jgi:hypothetical protein
MTKALVPVPNRTSVAFHPTVVKGILGLAAIFILGSWAFLSGQGYVGLVAGVVTFFTLVVLAIPFGLWRIRSSYDHHSALEPGHRYRSFGEWLKTDMAIWQDRLNGREAMITALLPIAAVALGAVLFAVAFHIATAT